MATPEEQREYQREWIRRRRDDYFRDKVCEWCGSSEKLELDHLDRSQKIDHRVWSWRAERREAELSKCRPLCRDCHLKRTRLQLSKAPRPHGLNKYRSEKCRCAECCEAHREYWRDRRAARRVLNRPEGPSVEPIAA